MGSAPLTPPGPLGPGSSAWVTASISSCGCSMLGWAAGSAGGQAPAALRGCRCARSLLPVGLTRCLRRIRFPAGGCGGVLFVVLSLPFVVGAGWWFWWPFLGWCVTENVHSLTACPAGGHFLVRQKVTKERPGLRPGPDGQRRQSLGGRSPNAAWTAWARFFCMGDSLNLNVWLLNAWLGGWPCGGIAPSSLVRWPVALAPSFRLA